MKKLFALILALGLLFSFAMAEEEVAAELSWDNVSEETKASGEFQQVVFQEPAVKLIYWVPTKLVAQDVSALADQGVVAAFATEDEAYAITVSALNVPSLEEYATGLGIAESAKLVMVNGLQTVAAEVEEQDIDMLIVPITETMILVYAFTPLNGDEEWDEVKGAIISSIQMAE